MHTPTDYVKSIWALGITEIFIYTLTGAIIYSFVGIEVASPALSSAGSMVSKFAYGFGLPVIFISGSINTTVVGRYIHGRVYANSVTRYINTTKGWISWLVLITVITVIAFIIAEVIPFFNDLLSLSSALFITGFTFYFPALMWFMLIREGPWHQGSNLWKSIINAVVFVIGVAILIGGTYASIYDIVRSLTSPFTLASQLTICRYTSSQMARCAVSFLAALSRKGATLHKLYDCDEYHERSGLVS
jgi:hypothetical protein